MTRPTAAPAAASSSSAAGGVPAADETPPTQGASEDATMASEDATMSAEELAQIAAALGGGKRGRHELAGLMAHTQTQADAWEAARSGGATRQRNARVITEARKSDVQANAQAKKASSKAKATMDDESFVLEATAVEPEEEDAVSKCQRTNQCLKNPNCERGFKHSGGRCRIRKK